MVFKHWVARRPHLQLFLYIKGHQPGVQGDRGRHSAGLSSIHSYAEALSLGVWILSKWLEFMAEDGSGYIISQGPKLTKVLGTKRSTVQSYSRYCENLFRRM